MLINKSNYIHTVFLSPLYFFNPHPRICLLILEREEERERERNVDLLPPVHDQTGDRTDNLGMCPDWELNPQPFGVQDDASSNQATWLGLFFRAQEVAFFINSCLSWYKSICIHSELFIKNIY